MDNNEIHVWLLNVTSWLKFLLPFRKRTLLQILLLYPSLGISLAIGLPLLLAIHYNTPLSALKQMLQPFSWPFLGFWATLGIFCSMCAVEMIIVSGYKMLVDITPLFCEEKTFKNAKDALFLSISESNKLCYLSSLIGLPALGMATCYLWQDPAFAFPWHIRIYLLILYAFAIFIFHSGVIWAFILIVFSYRSHSLLNGLKYLPNAPDRMNGLRPVMNIFMLLSGVWLFLSAITWPVLFRMFSLQFSNIAFLITILSYVVLILATELVISVALLIPVVIMSNWLRNVKRNLLEQISRELSQVWGTGGQDVSVLIMQFNEVEKMRVSPFRLSGAFATYLGTLGTIYSLIKSWIAFLP